MFIQTPIRNKSDKLSGLRPYVFAQLDERVYRLREAGVKDIVDLGKADPDEPTPSVIVKRLQKTAADPENHHYPAFAGSLHFRTAIADWYQHRFNVAVDAKTEVLALLGSKEGLFHISLAYLRAGDVALVPDPAFPAYNDGVWFAGGQTVRIPLVRERGWLPDLHAIDASVLAKAKLLFLNYPNNPSGALAPNDFLEDAVAFARKHHLLICYDHAYSEITFDGHKARSILEIPGAKDVAVEFMTYSKSYNMAGWRLGAAVGNSEALESLLIVQSHVNSGVFAPIQFAGVTALEKVWPSSHMTRMRHEYTRRRDYALGKLKSIGWDVDVPRGTVYLWVPAPLGLTGEDVASELLEKYRVVVAPGSAFGDEGKYYMRLSLTTAYPNVIKGMDRMAEFLSDKQPPQRKTSH